jgi:hypothetical protein
LYPRGVSITVPDMISTATPQPAQTSARKRPVRTFARHYAEMVIVMLLGMFVLGGAAAVLLSLVGVDVGDWQTDAVELSLLGMAVTMTVPMVAWMRYRGHGWAPTVEMSAAMMVPSFVAVGLLWAGVVEDAGALMGIEHVAMLAGMLLAMVLRLDEYTHSHHAR